MLRDLEILTIFGTSVTISPHVKLYCIERNLVEAIPHSDKIRERHFTYQESKAKRFYYGKPYSNAFTRGQVKFSSCCSWDKRYKRCRKLIKAIRSTNNYSPMTEKYSKWILMFFGDCASRQLCPVNKVTSL